MNGLQQLKFLALVVFSILVACGPVQRPVDGYGTADDLIGDFQKLREQVRSFRITGRVDHFGEDHRVQGKIYLFAELPHRLRIELVSPFGNSLSVLTVDKGEFALNDLRNNRFQTGPAEPCNIARLVKIPLPPEDVIRILIGHTPIIDGRHEIDWDTQGFYRVNVVARYEVQRLKIGPDKEVLPLLKSTLRDDKETIFSIDYDRWRPAGPVSVPHEIRVRMPKQKADLLLRYDADGVEINVPLPDDAWQQTAPPGVRVEQVNCRD